MGPCKDDIEHKLDEADAAADKSGKRYSSAEVFGIVRSHLNDAKNAASDQDVPAASARLINQSRHIYEDLAR